MSDLSHKGGTGEEEERQETGVEEMSALTVLDLFCGCGGFSHGLGQAGLEVILGIDVWDRAIESYKENMDSIGHNSVCADLTQLGPQECDERYLKGKTVDVLVGGPPCQSFSMAGRRDKSDPRNTLFREFVRYLDYYQPRAFLMENVMGILSKRTETGEKVIDVILGELGRQYSCRVNKLNAADFGVPQARKRVVVVGIRLDLGIIPEEIPPVLMVADRTPVGRVLEARETVGTAYYLSQRALDGIRRTREKNKAKGNGFGAQFIDMEKPCYTIVSTMWKDGYDALVRYSETEVRRLTVLELKRIQTFPDDYVIVGSKKETIIQIGNAVPPLLAYHLGGWLRGVLGS